MEEYNIKGLTSADARYLYKIHGKNEIELATEQSLILKYLSHFKEPMILLLLLSGLISTILGDFDDAFSIFIAIFIVVSVAFVQEYNSDKSLASISHLLPPMCLCYRDERAIQILAVDLVPGDLVILRTGDRIPADIRVIEAFGLKVDESSISGESNYVEKRPRISIDGPNDENILFMGTMIARGYAKGLVVNTGIHTQFGKLYSLMSYEQAPKSPLKLNMEYLSKQISAMSAAIIGIIILIGIIQRREVFPLLTMGVSLAVAAIPEGLPIVVTVTLAMGVIRMSKRKVIVKKMDVIESLGCVNMFCLDKTGTITSNRMCVSSIYASDGKYIEFGPTNYKFDHLEVKKNINFDESIAIEQVIKTCCICNDAYHSNGSIVGQSTDCALLQFSSKCGMYPETVYKKRLSEIPFSSETKWMMVTVLMTIQPNPVCYVKGAPEIVILKCSEYIMNNDIYPLNESIRDKFMGDVEKFSSRGNRVIATAYGPSDTSLIFLGLVNLSDPIRPDVPFVISQLKSRGITCKILTGDSKETAHSVARIIGLTDSHISMMSGYELNRLSNSDHDSFILSTNVFYRISPVDKINIVKSLRKNGNIVAMTGDGVNDAVALKAAHIGISMGLSGTDVCKEAADIVLTDDNMIHIVNAIDEGKTIFQNIQNFVRFQISSSIAAFGLTSLCIMFHLRLPLLSTQLLLINLIMDGPPAQSLGVEPPFIKNNIAKPRNPSDRILNTSIIISILTSSISMIILLICLYITLLGNGNEWKYITTIMFTAFVFFDLFNALNCRSQNISIFKLGLFSNRHLLISVLGSFICQILVLNLPLLQRIFKTTPLKCLEILLLILFASTVFFIDEIRKHINNRMVY